jgi:hypothetical protein
MPTDITTLLNSVNGSLRSLGFILIFSGVLEIQKGNILAGSILIVAGLGANIVYEFTPSNPVPAVPVVTTATSVSPIVPVTFPTTTTATTTVPDTTPVQQ